MSIPRRWWKRMAIAWTALILAGTLMPQTELVRGMEEGGRWIAIPHLDKLVHLILFGGFVGLWWRAVGDSAGRLMVIVAAGVALGVLTELGQAIPGLGRDAGLDDLVADLVGCVLAVALVRWWARRRAEGAARELKQGATVCR